MKINNLPEYAKNCRYIVVRLNGDDAWFWGAYEDLPKAYQSANEINGIVVEKEPFINKPCVSAGVCEHDKMQVLDKIRAELNSLHNGCGLFNDGVDASLKIIDKYRKESEE